MPSKSLPPSPSLDHLKYQAKDLLNASKAANSEALTRIREFHPKFTDKSQHEVQHSKFSLSDAQLVIAREYGFESWPKLKRYIESLSHPAVTSEEGSGFFDAVRRLDVEHVRRRLAQNPALVHTRVLGEVSSSKSFNISELRHATRVARDRETGGSAGDKKSWTALHFVVLHGYDELVTSIFLVRGADFDVPRHRYDQLTRMLLEHGADPNAVGWSGDEQCTPLELAAWEGSLEGVQMLLDHGADPNRNVRRQGRGSAALYSAAEHGRTAICEVLLRHGAKADVHSAAMLGRVDLLAELFETEPSSINSRDFRQRTPLDCAVQFGQTQAAEFLVQRGEAINIVQAAGLGMLQRVQQFVEANPGLVNPTDGGETPLMSAARNGQVEVMKFLLEQGANVHLGQKEYIHTIRPIHLADAAAVPLLVRAGADVNEPYRGYTPLQRAASEGDWQLMQVLAAHRGTQRFYLVGHLYEQVAELLLSLTLTECCFSPRVQEQLPEPLLVENPDVNEMDEPGKTALEYAIENQKRHAAQNPAKSTQFARLADVLRRHGAREGV